MSMLTIIISAAVIIVLFAVFVLSNRKYSVSEESMRKTTQNLLRERGGLKQKR